MSKHKTRDSSNSKFLDLIISEDGKISNFSEFERFLTDVKNKITSSMRIIKYSIEGVPTIEYLLFDGSNIWVIYDHTKENSPHSTIDFYKGNNIKIIKEKKHSEVHLYNNDELVVYIFAY